MDPVPFVTGEPEFSLLTDGTGNHAAELTHREADHAPSQVRIPQHRVEAELFDAPGNSVEDDPFPLPDLAEIEEESTLVIKFREGVLRGEGEPEEKNDRQTHEDPVSGGVKGDQRGGDRTEDGKNIETDVDKSQIEGTAFFPLQRKKPIDALVEIAQ